MLPRQPRACAKNDAIAFMRSTGSQPIIERCKVSDHERDDRAGPERRVAAHAVRGRILAQLNLAEPANQLGVEQVGVVAIRDGVGRREELFVARCEQFAQLTIECGEPARRPVGETSVVGEHAGERRVDRPAAVVIENQTQVDINQSIGREES